MLAIITLSAPALNIAPALRPRVCAPRMAAPSDDDVNELVARFGVPMAEPMTDRRTALGLMAGAAVATAFTPAAYAEDGMFSLPPLPYAYDALEPHIDAATMKVGNAQCRND